MNKSYFENAATIGIKSFKYQNLDAKFSKLINDLNCECKRILTEELNVNTESPKCCEKYAEFNIDRKVPLRQYFGKEVIDDTKTNENVCARYSYGVGSGSTTVGGDVATTQTKPMSKVMKKLCEKLQSLKEVRELIVNENERVNFNHVTILYYLIDNDRHKTCTLRPHCDLEVTASNKVKENNSQVAGSPTLVIALQKPKEITFYKRYSDGVKFDKNITDVGKMNMEETDIFFLHPEDERVIDRELYNEGTGKTENENRLSQFKHGVVCTRDKETMNDKSKRNKYQISISVCFRQTNTVRLYSAKNHTLIDEQGNKVDNDKGSIAMIKRAKKIELKRKELENKNNMERIDKKAKRFGRECHVENDNGVKKMKNKRRQNKRHSRKTK